MFAYLTDRSVIVDTTFFVGGRWCKFFDTITTCDDPPSISEQVYISDIVPFTDALRKTENIPHLRSNSFLIRAAHLHTLRDVLVPPFENNHIDVFEFYRKIVPFFLASDERIDPKNCCAIRKNKRRLFGGSHTVGRQIHRSEIDPRGGIRGVDK